MKAIFLIIPVMLLCTACDQPKSKEEIRNEIVQAEKAFEKMTSEKGIAEAFYYFADKNAVIKRENDTLIFGKDRQIIAGSMYGIDRYTGQLDHIVSTLSNIYQIKSNHIVSL